MGDPQEGTLPMTGLTLIEKIGMSLFYTLKAMAKPVNYILFTLAPTLGFGAAAVITGFVQERANGLDPFIWSFWSTNDPAVPSCSPEQENSPVHPSVDSDC